ncbi:MAG: glycosyltransferase [Halieaceae bacterium]|jgi:glycosyltransferase involved in cell wall biosynthesis|nr:glycosyltransferase [Halieaceae bacterium]
MKPRALIFTKRVLPASNTFVASQGNALSDFEPVYIGLRHDPSGRSLIDGSSTCILQDYTRFPGLARAMLDGLQRLSPAWRDALTDHQAVILHAHFGKGGYYCSPIAGALDLPLLTTFHGSDITQRDRLSYGRRHRETVFDRSERIIAVSKFIEGKLIEAGCPADKVLRHYIGIDTRFFSPGQQKRERPTILFVGRLIEQKGCQYLLQAMKTINRELPDAELLVAGYGSYEATLRRAAEDLRNVSFLGAQNRGEVRELMAEAWVTCLPSIRMARGNEEGLTTVAVESQAVGTPVVGFETGGVPEAVADQKTGLLCREKDVDALADRLLQVLRSPRLRDELASNGIARVNDLFCISKQTRKLEEIYHSVL